MKIEELFQNLSYAELSNLSISNEGSGEIAAPKHNALVGYTNSALLALYSRFVLREGQVPLRCKSHITTYRMESRYSTIGHVVGSTDPVYIEDSVAHPFEDDFIKVLGVYGPGGCRKSINDQDDPNGVFTPQPAVLQIPYPVEGQVLNIIYQARHKKLEFGDLNQEVDVPAVLETALTSYIAHMVFTFMNGQENAAKAAEYLTKYEIACTEVEKNDLVNNSASGNHTKFCKRGFV